MSRRTKLVYRTHEAKKVGSLLQTRKTSFARSISPPVNHLLFLQRTVGNQAVERLLKSGVIQPKLTIGQPGGVYEQEADRVAEQVMRMPDPSTAGRKAVFKDNEFLSVQRMCTGCEEELHRQPIEEEEEVLQTKEVSGRTPEVTPDVETQVNSIRSGGQPLPESVRAFFEPRFGYDFSQVRVHTDAKAAESATAVNALAYTMGRDIMFRTGHYAPETTQGKRLLAHELTQVVQQRGVTHRGAVMRSPDKKGFDEKKMFEIARKSKKVVELEKEAKKLGFSYAGQVSGENSYTDPAGKKIYIKKELTNEKAAVNYAYELQNAINVSTKYKEIFDKAEKGKFKDASEYATAMLSVEAEALITEAEVSIELGMESWKAVRELVEKYKKGKIKLDELKKSVLKLAETGVIDGMNAKKYYEKQYKDVYGK